MTLDMLLITASGLVFVAVTILAITARRNSENGIDKASRVRSDLSDHDRNRDGPNRR